MDVNNIINGFAHKHSCSRFNQQQMIEALILELEELKGLKNADAPEEPKVGYIIDPMEEDCISADDSGYEEPDVERAKELGIWLETKEEAKKVVEKLKALNKLCRKGFEFDGVEMFGSGFIRIEASIPINEKTTLQERSDITDSLYLLFGGEE